MENQKKVEQRPDWSNMSTEILEEFCKRLTIPNQVRFSSVCKPWHFANTSKKAYHWIPDTPWLVDKDYNHVQFKVISNTDRQAYEIFKPFKPLLDTSIVGSFKGWLVLNSKFKLFIINLFSKLHLDLPSLSTVSCLQCIKGDYFSYVHSSPYAFAISMCPNLNPTSVAMVTFSGCLGWCKVGDTTWKCHHPSGELYADVAFNNDKLYVVDREGEKVSMFKYDEGVLVQVGSVESPKPSGNIRLSRSIDKRIYLVECGGRVLVVRRITHYKKYLKATVNFVILMVEENSSTPQLVEVQSLDDHILFLANSDIECLDAKYCPGFQRGCIYFTCYLKYNHTPEVREFSVANGILRSIFPIDRNMYCPIWVLPRFPFDCDCENCTSSQWITLEEMEEELVLELKQRRIFYI